MKNNLVLTFLFLSVVFPWTLKAQMTAIEYNDFIVNEQNKIGVKIIDFTTALDALDFTLAETNLGLLQERVNEVIKNVEDQGPYPNNDGLYTAVLDLFRFYKTIVNNEYREILTTLQKESLETNDFDRLNILVASITDREKLVDEAFQSAQQKFASDNNFELTENEFQQQIDQ